MLRKMYLVSPDYLNTVTSKNTPPPLPQSPNTEKAGKKHNSSKRLRSVNRKYLSQREHDRWVAKRSAARRGLTMISGLKYVANFARRISKEPDKDCSRFLKTSTTGLAVLGYADRTGSPRGTRTTTSSCNPHKTTTFIM